MKSVMTKIKNFIKSIPHYISEGWYHFTRFIRKYWDKLWNLSFMRKVKEVLQIIPNWLADNIPYKKRKLIWGVVFILPLMIGFVYFFFIPFINSLVYSFSYVNNEAEGGKLLSYFIGLKNYQYIFTEAANTDGTFTEIMVEAVLDIIFDIPVILIFSLIVAVVLNSKFKGRAFVRAVFFMPVIFNSQAINLAMTSATALSNFMDSVNNDIFSNMFNFKDFLLNANIPAFGVTFLGNAVSKIYEIISYSGVQILIFLSAIQSVPKHLYEAAKMEGATQYEMFWKITFPMVSPMMLTAAVYTVVDSFLTSPLIDIINSYNSAGFQESKILGKISNYGINAAMSWIFCLIGIAIIGLTLLILSKAVFYYDEK